MGNSLVYREGIILENGAKMRGGTHSLPERGTRLPPVRKKVPKNSGVNYRINQLIIWVALQQK